LQDSHAVRSIDFHPSGDFIVAATDHEAPRTYDIASGSCFTPPNGADYHRGPINYVRYSPNGANFVTASDDGSLKIFDVVSGRCVFTWDNAHKSSPVWSCRFTRNSKYVLSTGGDSTVKLWDMGLGRVVKTYEGGSFVVSRVVIVRTKVHQLIVVIADRLPQSRQRYPLTKTTSSAETIGPTRYFAGIREPEGRL
jgi:WD40 repeat protein